MGPVVKFQKADVIAEPGHLQKLVSFDGAEIILKQTALIQALQMKDGKAKK